MPTFRAERDTRFDYYFSVDIQRALTEVAQTDLYTALSPADDRVQLLQQQGFDAAVTRFAEIFGFSYQPLRSL